MFPDAPSNDTYPEDIFMMMMMMFSKDFKGRSIDRKGSFLPALYASKSGLKYLGIQYKAIPVWLYLSLLLAIFLF